MAAEGVGVNGGLVAGAKAQGHSPYGASNCERWTGCPGSIQAAAKYPPSKSSIYAAEGHAAHDLLERLLRNKLNKGTLMALVGTKVETEDGYKIPVTEEMVEAVLLHFDTVVKDYEEMKAQNKPAPITLMVETPICASSVSEEAWGTLDSGLAQKGNALKIHDLKYGKGKLVEVVNNKQLLQYLLSVVDTLKCEAFDYIEGVIVQPRMAHPDGRVRRWRIGIDKLREFRAYLIERIAATKAPNAPRVADNDWCKYCPAYADCPEARALVQKNTALDFAAIPAAGQVAEAAVTKGLMDPALMTPEIMARVMNVKSMVKDWFDAVSERALDYVERQGGQIPGYKMVTGRAGNRVWTDEKAVIAQLEGDLGEGIYTPKELKSPAALEAVVGKKIVDALTTRPEGKKTLAPMADARKESKVSGAAADFAHIPPPAGAKKSEQQIAEEALADLM